MSIAAYAIGVFIAACLAIGTFLVYICGTDTYDKE